MLKAGANPRGMQGYAVGRVLPANGGWVGKRGTRRAAVLRQAGRFGPYSDPKPSRLVKPDALTTL